MDFRILGPLEVLDERRAITLGGTRLRALLALLLLHANETLSTDRLIDDLWGERPPANAAKTVQMQVSRLRKALAGGAGDGAAGLLVTRERGYELKVDPERVDAHRFERLVAEGRSELAQGRADGAVSALEAALTLWRGQPLAELAYEPFAQREIARLDELRVDALEQLIEAKLALGAHAEVVGQLEALIAEHPYRERLRAQLMLALYRSDRQADALQAYQEARRALVDELGIEPGERLRELEAAILAQDPQLHLPAAEEQAPAEAAVESSRGAFVGRERELNELVGGLEDACAGHGRLFMLSGEPGIGKSRLAEELVGQARPRGMRVLVGRCWEAGGAPAYWPWVQALRTYVGANEPAALRSQLGAGAAELAHLLPELRQRVPGLPEPSAAESEGARFRLFDATAQFLRNASESRPIVLVLDDLHAADAPSLLLLRFVARALDSSRMLVLGAYRDVDPLPGGPLTELLTEIAREPVTRRLVLSGLSDREVERYVELTAANVASSELVAGLRERTEGNPLFVGEFVRLLSVEGDWAEPSIEPRPAVPQSVRAVIARRLSYLSEECNRVLVLASVLGREFALDALARMADLPEEALLDLLDEALAARVVSDLPGGAGQLRFAHVLIRDALYEGSTTARRVRLHRLAVESLEALYGDEAGPHLAELGHHSIAARDFAKGVRYAQQAGDHALALLAYEEAARLYETALEALHLGDDDERTRCDLQLSLGEARIRAGDAPAARRAFVTAADIARRRGLRRELARAAAGYGGRIVWARAAGDRQLVPLLEEGLAALADEDIGLRARLLARLAGALRDEPSRARRDRLSREAVELARSAGEPAALAYALGGRAEVICAPDTVAECLALSGELLEVAEEIGDLERLVQGHSDRCFAHLQLGEVAQAVRHADAAGRIAHELRQPAHLWQAAGLQAMLSLASGQLAGADELIERAFAFGERSQSGAASAVYRMQRYTLRDFRGTLGEDDVRDIRGLAAEHPARPVFRCAEAYLYARLGRLGEARETVGRLAADDFAGVPFDHEWLYGVSFLAETVASLGERDAAAVLYGLLLPWAARNAVDQAEGIRGSVARYLGLLAACEGRWDDAESHFEHAIAMNEEMGARPWLAHSKSDYARMLHARNRRGDSERAGALLDSARETYREIGMEAGLARPLGGA